MSALQDLEHGLDELDGIFEELLWAALPHPAALTFSELTFDLQGKRDLVFALALLKEGENECVLILGLARDALRRSPGADLDHTIREAWYYLRTSIDPGWQIDDGSPSVAAALAYVASVTRERLARVRATKPSRPVDPAPAGERKALLQRLRAASTALR